MPFLRLADRPRNEKSASRGATYILGLSEYYHIFWTNAIVTGNCIQGQIQGQNAKSAPRALGTFFDFALNNIYENGPYVNP